MLRSRITAAAVLSTFLCAITLQGKGQVPPSFFGMQMNHEITLGEPWPVDSFTTTRLWDSGTAWAMINTAPGEYDWSMFDIWLNDALQHNVDVVYAFGRTPLWASSNPSNANCADAPGQCEPPNDLNADGTGTNQHWKDFVSAIATRAAGRIHFWEIWDEAPNPMRWNGTIAQMMRLAKDARSIIKTVDPTAIILSPSSGIRYTRDTTWATEYYAAGGGSYADVIAVHGYIQKSGLFPVPEDFVKFINSYKSILRTNHQAWKPLWDTEASWGIPTCCNFLDPDLQAGFLARFLLLHWSTNIQRFYWYEWNNISAGTLWLANYSQLNAPGTLLQPGIAYQQVYNWMVGASLTAPCSVQGTVWTCNFSRTGGYLAQAVWDTSQTCSNGTCTTSNYTVSPGFIKYSTVYGQVVGITATTVPIGYQPILLTNQ